MPALLTSMSSRPYVCTTWSTIAVTASASVTSQPMPMASPPAAVISSAAALAAAGVQVDHGDPGALGGQPGGGGRPDALGRRR